MAAMRFKGRPSRHAGWTAPRVEKVAKSHFFEFSQHLPPLTLPAANAGAGMKSRGCGSLTIPGLFDRLRLRIKPCGALLWFGCLFFHRRYGAEHLLRAGSKGSAGHAPAPWPPQAQAEPAGWQNKRQFRFDSRPQHRPPSRPQRQASPRRTACRAALCRWALFPSLFGNPCGLPPL